MPGCLQLRARAACFIVALLGAVLAPTVDAAALTVPGRSIAALAPMPPISGPITCSQSSLLAFRYTPDAETPPLRGFEITVQAGGPLDFGELDIAEADGLASVGDPTHFEVVDNLDGTFTVAGAILGTTLGLTVAADLFTINFHGSTTGDGLVEITHYKLRDLDNVDILASLADATVMVDCLPPEVPALTPEPSYTQGIENNLAWSDMSGSGAVEYLVQRASDAGFTLDLADSGWQAALDYTFTGLADGQLYHYRVMTRDALANESAWSAPEVSTQDATAPATSAGPLGPYQGTLSFALPFMASDAVSGFVSLQLFVDVDGGGYAAAGTYTSSPIAFVAGGDGVYSFYTVGTDAVGNLETPPGTPDAVTTVDTTAPTGGFVINSDLAFTNSLVVNLSNAVTDPHPPLEMRFSNDLATWSDWEPYQAARPWTLSAGADGPRVVYGQFRDMLANTHPAQDAIVYDATAPGAASALHLTRGHEEVQVTWSDPGDGDLAAVEIYRGVWHDGAYASAYPEYDDLPGNTLPAHPASRAAAVASPEWELAGTAAPGAESFTDAWAPRGYYCYQVFPMDAAFNFGPPLAANAGPVANYWLGDVFDSGTGDGFYDGFVNLGDITVMGAAFGTCDGAAEYDNEVDIGPTSDNSVLGIPTTDSCIDFEDLILFAINYGMVAPLTAPSANLGPVQLSWYRIDENTWGCGLLAPNGRLKGLRLHADLPAGTPVQVSPGAALAEQGPYFLANIDANGIDVNLAILGTGRAFAGTGELLRVTLPAGLAPGTIAVTARSLENAPLEFVLTDEVIPDLPQAYRLTQNHPNPFNPKTTIAFDLPAPQPARVSVFGADGRLLRVLLDQPLSAGYHSVVWDGRDAAGEQVASGVYFYHVQAGPLDETRKMLLLK